MPLSKELTKTRRNERSKRTTERITPEQAFKKRSRVSKDAAHRETKAVASVVDGEVFITAQMSELVPVADYASVTLGPYQIQWKLGGINMEDLIEVDWGDEDEDGVQVFDDDNLTDTQRVAYERIRGAMRATAKVLEHGIAEDRDAVLLSVKAHNRREAEEAKQQRKGNGSRKR